MFDNLIRKLEAVGAMLGSPGSMFSLWQLGFAFGLAFAFLALRHWRRRGRLRLGRSAAPFSPALLRNRSTTADARLFSGQHAGARRPDRLDDPFRRYDRACRARRLRCLFRRPRSAPDARGRVPRGGDLILFLAYEFGYWLDQYLKHTVPALWELHKPHHTAEALTPLTVFRVHPLDTLMFVNVLAIVGGLASALSSYAFGEETRAFVFDGANVLIVGSMYGYVHLQHSEFWIPIPGPLGRVFMSPAHHQIHHSTSAAHFNRNFGSCLALFDWLFGTLAVPTKNSPRLRFGVNEPDADPHTVTALLIDPVGKALAALMPCTAFSWRRKRTGRRFADRKT